MRSPVLVDTSAFYALNNLNNPLEHEEALKTSRELETTGALLITTDYILDETYTLLRSLLGHRTAVSFGKEIQAGGIEIVQVDPGIQKKAFQIFEKYSDKDFSFTDCTSFAVMERGSMKSAFTFDRHFQQYGMMTLPSNLPSRKK